MTPEKLAAWLAAAGGRRFSMAMAAGFVSTALFIFGKLTQEHYMALQMGTVVAYLTVNNHEKSLEKAIARNS